METPTSPARAERPRVWLGYVHAHTVTTGFMQSLLEAHSRYEGPHGFRGFPGHGLIIARNEMTRHFLDSGADYMLSVDTDIIFPAFAVDRLLSRDAPVVSAFYWTVDEGAQDTRWGLWPTVMRDGKAVDPRSEPSVFEADAVGAGFLLVHRRAIDAVTERFGETWWDLRDGLGEDYSFCRRLREAGFKILVDQTLLVRHQKTAWV